MNEMTFARKSQMELVLEYLNCNFTITPLKARHLFRIERLAAVINRLRNKGFDIRNIISTDETGRQYSCYRLYDAPRKAQGGLF